MLRQTIGSLIQTTTQPQNSTRHANNFNIRFKQQKRHYICRTFNKTYKHEAMCMNYEGVNGYLKQNYTVLSSLPSFLVIMVNLFD